jgi:hypothetical protein
MPWTTLAHITSLFMIEVIIMGRSGMCLGALTHDHL